MANFPVLSRILHAVLFEDWMLKFICLLLAVLMWFYIDGELTDTKDFIIPLQESQVHVPPGYVLVPGQQLPSYTVQVRGPRRRLPLTGPENFRIKRKAFDEPRNGKNSYMLQPGDFVAEGFEILTVAPNQRDPGVYLIATSTQMKRVFVKTSRAKKGFYVEKAITEPTQVTIEGPTEDLEKITQVYTTEIDISNAEEGEISTMAVIEEAVDVDGLTVKFRVPEKDRRVRANVVIKPEAGARRVPLIVRPVPLPGTAMMIEPETVQVEVIAEERDIVDVASKVTLYVDWPPAWEKPKDANTVLGPLSLPVRAEHPARIQVRGIDGPNLPTVTVRGALAPSLNNKEQP
jgi:hypothetical protein